MLANTLCLFYLPEGYTTSVQNENVMPGRETTVASVQILSTL